MDEAFVGVDVGTGSARAGVFDGAGRLLATARRPIAMWREAGDIVEQSSADIWASVCAATRDALSRAGVAPRTVAGLGFDATCSLVALDIDGAPLPVGPSGQPHRDTIVWMDHRAAREADEIDAVEVVALRYAGAVSPEMQAPKLMWLARHMPTTFANAQFFDLADFLTYRATGSRARSHCTVAAKWPYLAREGRWASEFLAHFGLAALAENDFSRIGARIVAPGRALGAGLTREAAEATGLEPGTPVGAGLIDAHCGAFATLGGAHPDSPSDPQRRLALILGTSGCCMALSRTPRNLDGLWGPYYSPILPGLWLNEGGLSAFGSAIDRLMRLFPSGNAAESFEAMEQEIVARAGSLSRAALLARDIHILPDFIGRRSPDPDAGARAAVVGLDFAEDDASRHGLYMAGLTGLAHGLAQVLRTLETDGFAFDLLTASGGASRSALVRQVVADATGRRVAVPETTEPVLLGGAMLGAVAAGRHTMASAMTAMSRLGEVKEPAGGEIAAFHARKRIAFETLRRTERNLRALMRDGASVRGESTVGDPLPPCGDGLAWGVTSRSRGAFTPTPTLPHQGGGRVRGPSGSIEPSSDWPALVIFDCDGVLVDSEVIALGALRAALARLGVDLSFERTRDLFLGVSQKTMRDVTRATLGLGLPEGFEASLARDTIAAFETDLVGVEGLREALGGLDAPVCVASSSPPARIRASLGIVGYADLFGERVFSASGVNRGKPAPDLFLLAAERLGALAQACLVIEDSPPGVEAARAAGMTVFGFTGGAHAQGAAYHERLRVAGASQIFDDMRTLPILVAAEREARRRQRHG